MALTTAKSKAAIESAGGGRIEAIEVQDSGANLTSPDTKHDLGYIKESTITDKVDVEKVYDESEDIVTSIYKNRETGFSGVFLQSGKAQYAFADEVRDKYYRAMKFEGLKGDDYIEIFYGCGQFLPNMIIKHSDGTIPFEFTGTKLDSAVSFTASAFTSYCGAGFGNGITGLSGSLSASNITIPAGKTHVKIATNKTTGLATVLNS